MSEGNWILLTGCSTGIGRASALHLAKSGFSVLAGVRQEADAEDLKQAINGYGSLHPLLIDVADAESISQAAAKTEELTGPAGLRSLVNNAGIGGHGPIEFLSHEDWLKQFEVNLFGQAAMTQAMLPLLRRYADRGESTARVIMIGSIAGRLAVPTLGRYCASKSALRTLSAALRMELRPQKIDVSLIEPGAIQSAIWNKGKEADSKLGPDHPCRQKYGKAIDAINAISAKSAKSAIPAEAVARVVEKCITRRRPKTSILVGMDAKMGAALQWLLPESWFEAIVRKAVGF